MKITLRRWWLTPIALLLLLPAASATLSHPKDKPRHRHWNVPEGGSALVYVVGTGVTCLGAMVVRSRSEKLKQS
jgi:hypothetical protein